MMPFTDHCPGSESGFHEIRDRALKAENYMNIIHGMKALTPISSFSFYKTPWYLLELTSI